MGVSHTSISIFLLGLVSLWNNCFCEQLVKQTGSDLTLTCKNSMGQQMEWQKNINDTIPEDSVSSQTVGKDVTLNLALNNLNTTDAGDYVCAGQTNSVTYKTYSIAIISITGTGQSITDNVTSAELSCQVDNSDLMVAGIKWKREGSDLDVSDKYTIEVNGSSTSLSVKDLGDEDAGVYTCVVTLEQMNDTEFEHVFSIDVAPTVHSISKLRSKVEGETAKILCNVTGYPTPEIVWYRMLEEEEEMKPITYDDRVNVTAHEGVPAATLLIKDLKISADRGDYMCVATNFLGSGNATVTLKVKDKLAAVWPFLGICAEVAILCSIIFIFEKRRNRRLEEEEEVDAVKQDLMNKSNGTDEKELRQRSNATKA